MGNPRQHQEQSQLGGPAVTERGAETQGVGGLLERQKQTEDASQLGALRKVGGLVEFPAQQAAESFNAGRRPVRQVGDGAIPDLAVLPEGFAQEDGGRELRLGTVAIYMTSIYSKLTALSRISYIYMTTICRANSANPLRYKDFNQLPRGRSVHGNATDRCLAAQTQSGRSSSLLPRCVPGKRPDFTVVGKSFTVDFSGCGGWKHLLPATAPYVVKSRSKRCLLWAYAGVVPKNLAIQRFVDDAPDSAPQFSWRYHDTKLPILEDEGRM